MKLEPKAKPVRIRIKSGGEEHFNLESLKRSFSVQDLWESVTGGRLSRWLRQQNEFELAKQVESFCQIEKPSIEEYIKFSSLFFENEMEGVPNDANALVKFYKERNLRKNFHFAFSYLLHSLDYQTGKIWYDEYKGTKNTEDWIAFFETKMPQLQGEEEIECYQFLYKLHCVNNDLAKMKYCQSKVKDSIVNLAKKDKGRLDKWLASGDYFYAKLLFEDEITRGLKSTSDWIGIFEAKLPQLQDEEEIECYQSLCILHSVKHDKVKLEYCLARAKDLIIGLAKKDKSRLEKWLVSGNYFYVKLLYEDEAIRGLKSKNEWLAYFERCKYHLLATQQGEFFYYLYLLSEANGEKVKAKEYLKKSSSFGYEEAEKRLAEVRENYPKLTAILNRYRSNDKQISFNDLENVIQNILEIENEDEYYGVCHYCIQMLKDCEPLNLDLANQMMAISRIEYSIDAISRRFPKYESLIVLIGTLCCEIFYSSPIGRVFHSENPYAKLLERIKDDSPYMTIFQLKLSKKTVIITAENGSECDLRNASIVEQIFFFMETHGESYKCYEVKKIN